MSPWIAVTGGSGYIGSHIAAQLKQTLGCRVVIIDWDAANQPHTHRFADEIVYDDIISLSAFGALARLRPHAIIHCAGTSLVGPSVSNPAVYYQNNVCKTVELLEFMRKHDLKNIVFSSSASVYGESWATICSEDHKTNPINPYGRTKTMIENILDDYHKAYGINNFRFRYFNAAGADPNGGLGQAPGATHLVARIIESIINNQTLTVYSNTYPTTDGTCVRDYAHVSDIARAHVLAVNYLDNTPGSHVANLGSGTGTTVLEMIKAAETVTGQKVNYQIGNTRLGDPAILIADITRANNLLNWRPEYSINDIIQHAWNWYHSSIYQKSIR